MQSSHAAIENKLIEQIVSKPEFRKLVNLPAFAWQELLLIAGAYGVIFSGLWFYQAGVIPYILLLVTSMLARYSLFTPLHDATHNALSGKQKINDFFGTVAAQALFVGGTTSVYRFLHLEHHRHTGDPERDPDEKTVSGTPIERFLSMALIEFYWLYWYFKNHEMRSRAAKTKDLCSLAIFLAWHIAWLVSPYAEEFLLLWLLPQRLGILTVAYLFAAIQHPEGIEQSERPLQATRMFTTGTLARYLMISQSQHLMHHMFPKVPFYRYNAAWSLSKPMLKTREIVWSPLIGQRAMPKPIAEQSATINVVIEAVDRVSSEVVSYTFKAADGLALPEYKPGAHIDVHIDDSLIRQYSLTSLSAPGTYNIAVKREDNGRGGSKALHDSFAVGKALSISHPRNLFELGEGTGHITLVAGGIGITPLLAMADKLNQQGREFTFHICARSLEVQPFADFLKQAPYADKVKIYLDSESQSLQADNIGQWQQGNELYMCGPAGFMGYVTGLADSQGWPLEDIHSENFAAIEQQYDNKPFTVELARSKKVFEVKAEESLLDVLQSNGIPVAASCVQGLCGTCECKVISGEVEHRDSIFTDEEKRQGKMTACVSRAKHDHIVIDA